MRALIGLAALAALTVPSLAQQPRPPGQRPPAQRPQAQPPTPPAPPPGMFPCRSEGEVCFIGVVTGPSQIAVLFTNAPQAESIEAKPVDLSSAEAPGTALDLAGSLGRVVMVTGTYAAASGITKAQVVDTASPLLSFMMKQSAGGDEGQPAPQRSGGKPPKRR
ncbi:MAG TPA: hypothetical protein VF744_03880 [Beijerinckiaceae bacterium]|jgi:hypothetical protein